VYNDDLVISNSYAVLYLTNQQGQVVTYPLRSSVVWAKIGGRWQIVDQHGSRLPVAP
jgi:ketosteroid isomerase-like protein